MAKANQKIEMKNFDIDIEDIQSIDVPEKLLWVKQPQAKFKRGFKQYIYGYLVKAKKPLTASQLAVLLWRHEGIELSEKQMYSCLKTMGQKDEIIIHSS